MSKAIKISIRNLEAELPIGSMWVPAKATMELLHATLQILLNTETYTSYAFMLLRQHRSIDQFMASKVTIFNVFENNEIIRYQNPYPGSYIVILERTEVVEDYNMNYPIVAGMPSEKEYNNLLKQYCSYDINWKNTWDGGMCIGGQSPVFPYKQKKSSKITQEEEAHSCYFPRNMKDKKIILTSSLLTGRRCATVNNNIGNQQGFLKSLEKASLIRYCQYAGFTIKTNWKKDVLANIFSQCLAENPWYYLILLPKEALDLYIKLIKFKGTTPFQLEDTGSTISSMELFLYLGMMDIHLKMDRNKKEIIILTLAEETVITFEQYINRKENYGRMSKAAIYLSSELPCDGRNKILKGYNILSIRIADLLRYYAVLTVEELCNMLKQLYEYHFNASEFTRYVMMHMRLLNQVTTAVDISDGIRYVGLNGMNLVSAMERGKEYHHTYREVSILKLEEFEEQMVFLCENFMEQLAFVSETIDIDYVTEKIIASIEGNTYWDEVCVLLQGNIKPFELNDYGLWYALCNLYLYLPVAALSGNSRIEYADEGNPFCIVNMKIENSRKEDTVFFQPFEIQWEFYQMCSQFVENQNILESKRIKRFARDKFNDYHMNPEDLLGIGNMPWDDDENDWYDEIIPQKPVVHDEKKIYPNDPCACGSGKKYKKCCGK